MRYRIVGYGNSITEAVQMSDENKRWLNVLKQLLAETFPDDGFSVINAGVGGNSDREKIARLERDVLAHDPDFVLLEFGGNNSDPNRPERRVSLREAEECLESVKKSISAKARLVVITFPPVIDEQHIYYGHPFFEDKGGLEANIETYRVLSRDFAQRNHFPLIDFGRELAAKMKVDGANVYILPDGVHLTEKGNLELANLVFEALKSEILKKSGGDKA